MSGTCFAGLFGLAFLGQALLLGLFGNACRFGEAGFLGFALLGQPLLFGFLRGTSSVSLAGLLGLPLLGETLLLGLLVLLLSLARGRLGLCLLQHVRLVGLALLGGLASAPPCDELRPPGQRNLPFGLGLLGLRFAPLRFLGRARELFRNRVGRALIGASCSTDQQQASERDRTDSVAAEPLRGNSHLLLAMQCRVPRSLPGAAKARSNLAN